MAAGLVDRVQAIRRALTIPLGRAAIPLMICQVRWRGR
jgi:hypothetical protein